VNKSSGMCENPSLITYSIDDDGVVDISYHLVDCKKDDVDNLESSHALLVTMLSFPKDLRYIL